MKNYRIEIKWAIIFTIMMMVWMYLEKVVGLHHEHIDKHPIYTNFISIPAIAIYALALIDKRRNFYSDNMSYKQGLVAGVIITLIVAVLTPLTQSLTFRFISPDYFPNVIRHVVSQKAMTQQAAEDYFSLNNYIIQGFIGALAMGLVTAVIVAFFTRSKAKEDR